MAKMHGSCWKIEAHTAFSPFCIFVQHELKIGLDGDIAFGPTFICMVVAQVRFKLSQVAITIVSGIISKMHASDWKSNDS